MLKQVQLTGVCGMMKRGQMLKQLQIPKRVRDRVQHDRCVGEIPKQMQIPKRVQMLKQLQIPKQVRDKVQHDKEKDGFVRDAEKGSA